MLHRTRGYVVEYHAFIHDALKNPLFENLEEVSTLKKSLDGLKKRFQSQLITNPDQARMAAATTLYGKRMTSRIQEYMRTHEKYIQVKAGSEAAFVWTSLIPSVEFLQRRIIKCHAAINTAVKVA